MGIKHHLQNTCWTSLRQHMHNAAKKKNNSEESKLYKTDFSILYSSMQKLKLYLLDSQMVSIHHAVFDFFVWRLLQSLIAVWTKLLKFSFIRTFQKKRRKKKSLELSVKQVKHFCCIMHTFSDKLRKFVK